MTGATGRGRPSYRMEIAVVARAVPARPVARRPLGAAAITGTALNLVDRGGAMLQGGGVDRLKLVPARRAPHDVTAHGAASARRSARAAGRPPPSPPADDHADLSGMTRD